MKGRLVYITGPTGVGKSTLAENLSDILGWEIVPEPYNKNPFLEDHHTGEEDFTFEMETSFLVTNFKLSREINKNYIECGDDVICDWHPLQSIVFAKQTLDKKRFSLFSDIAYLLSKNLPPHDATILLDAKAGLIKERIEERGRDFESSLTLDYLQGLRNGFDSFEDVLKRHDYKRKFFSISTDKYNPSTDDKKTQYIAHKLYNIKQ